jgi:hypothetical protein
VASARRATNLTADAAARARALDALRSAIAPRTALLEDVGRLAATAEHGLGGLGARVESVMSDGAAALWSSLDEGLREWRAAAGEQEDRLAALRTDARCGEGGDGGGGVWWRRLS